MFSVPISKYSKCIPPLLKSDLILILVYTGKILNDDTPLKEYKIDEKNFVVVMITKVNVSFIEQLENKVLLPVL